MKLAFVCGFAWEPRGTVRARAFPLAAELARRGHQVSVFTVPYDNLKESGVEYIRDGVRIVNLNISSTSIVDLALAPIRLARQVREWAPDLVHVFKPKGFAGAVGELLIRKRNVPMVLDCDDWEGWGGWNDVTHYSWIVKQWIDWQERSLITRTPIVTVASHVLANRAYGLGKKCKEVFHVPNCASRELLSLGERLTQETTAFWKSELGLPPQMAILYVGHFDPLDDVLFFCKQVAQVAVRFQATVLIVGDGPDLPDAKKFFAQKPAVRTHYAGVLNFDDYSRIVAACDIATFPYPDNGVYRAKCSARIIDFMAFSKPILTSAVGENSHYLINGESGILVPAHDGPAYASALELLLLHPELRETLGRGARQRLEKYFVWGGASIGNCLSAYETVLRTPVGAEQIATSC